MPERASLAVELGPIKGYEKMPFTVMFFLIPVAVTIILFLFIVLFCLRIRTRSAAVKQHKELLAESGDVSTLQNRPTTDDTSSA